MELGERIAVLETKMDNLEKQQEKVVEKLDEQTKQIYKALGALAAVIVIVELVIAFIKH